MSPEEQALWDAIVAGCAAEAAFDGDDEGLAKKADERAMKIITRRRARMRSPNE